MQVNTKKVNGRRQVRYESLDDLLNDAQRLSTIELRTLGNWSQGQIYQHLSMSLNASIDGFSFAFPVPVRWLMSVLMKKRFLKKELPPGFKSKANYVPKETSTAEGLAALQKSIERQKQETRRAAHPGFGDLTLEEWNDFNLRHAEMHMSFLAENRDASYSFTSNDSEPTRTK